MKDAFRLLNLPDEILLIIGEHLPSENDLNSFHQTNRRLYQVLNDYLYRSNALRALFWELGHEEPKTARNSILAGTSGQGSVSLAIQLEWWTILAPVQIYPTLIQPTGRIEEPLFVAGRQ